MLLFMRELSFQHSNMSICMKESNSHNIVKQNFWTDICVEYDENA